jgi:hypothetical protein
MQLAFCAVLDGLRIAWASKASMKDLWEQQMLLWDSKLSFLL